MAESQCRGCGRSNFQVQSFYNDEKVEEITIGVPAGQYAEKTYLNHKPVNRLRISSDQDFSLDSVYIDHLQKTQGGEEGPLQKKVAAFVVVLILVSCWLAKREKTELLINKCKDSFKNLGSYLQHHPKHVLDHGIVVCMCGCLWMGSAESLCHGSSSRKLAVYLQKCDLWCDAWPDRL